MISVNFIIRNGLINGYPFWESLMSCLAFADQVVISDGESHDGTYEALQRFRSLYGLIVPIEIHVDSWGTSPCGEEIARISQINHERCNGDWVYYLQADEIVDPRSSQLIKATGRIDNIPYQAIAFPFVHYQLGWKPGQGYDHAMRMARNTKDIRYAGDGWTFTGEVLPYVVARYPVHHLGWVFPYNCDRKAMEHAALYQERIDYQAQAFEAEQRMSMPGEYAGHPRPEELTGYPPLMERLFGMAKYELPPEAYEDGSDH